MVKNGPGKLRRGRADRAAHVGHASEKMGTSGRPPFAPVSACLIFDVLVQKDVYVLSFASSESQKTAADTQAHKHSHGSRFRYIGGSRLGVKYTRDGGRECPDVPNSIGGTDSAAANFGPKIPLAVSVVSVMLNE
jgi:hypothetical protein